MPSVGSAANGEPGTPDQNVPVPASAAWRPRRGGGSEGDFPPSVHWDSDVEANHTPGGSRRQREEPSLPRRMWDSLPAVAASAAASPTPGRNGAVEGREVKALGLQWDWRQTFEGWELAAAFAAALMLVNGIALSHAAGPGITFFRGVHPYCFGMAASVGLCPRCLKAEGGRAVTMRTEPAADVQTPIAAVHQCSLKAACIPLLADHDTCG